MLGAGVFSVFGPAASYAGAWLPLAVFLAALVSFLNAMSISQLAAVVQRSGGAYSYARHYLNPVAGFLAGSSFLLGKIGSIAAIALTFGTYLTPGLETETALAAILAMTIVNILGVNHTASGAKVLAGITIGFFAILIVLALCIGEVSSPLSAEVTPKDVLTAAAMLFFAFAGYARVATLGGEVRHPETSIPKAIKISLGLVFCLYLVLSFLLPLRLGASLTVSEAAIRDLMSGTLPQAGQYVWLFSSIAALGSLLALLAGMGRTLATMAEDGEMPGFFSRRNQRNAPWIAELSLAGVASVLVISGSYIVLVGISSFCILHYYALANWAAIRQPVSETNVAKIWNWCGLILCITLAFAVPAEAIVLAAVSLVTLVILRTILADRQPKR